MAENKMIDAADHARISEAIRQAEDRTSGEIYAVLARSSDDYLFAAGFVVTCGILLASVIVAFLAHWYWFDIRLPVFGLAILTAFLSAMLVLWLFPALRIRFVPKRIRYKRSHLNAVQQFLARNVHRTEQRTGILLFVSMAEHYAEVVADAGINGRVAQQEWNSIVATLVQHASRAAMVDGFVLAINQAGNLLASHFPAGADDVNELDDHLVEL